MSGDVHVRICEHLGGRFPGVTRRVLHCKSEAQAKLVVNKIKARFEACGFAHLYR